MYIFFFRLLSHIGYRVLSSLYCRVRPCWLSTLYIVVCLCWFQPSNLFPPLKKLLLKIVSTAINATLMQFITQRTFSLLKAFFSLASSPSLWLLNLNFEFSSLFILSSPIFFPSESFVSLSSRYHPNNCRLHLPSLTPIAWPPSGTVCNEIVT